MTQEREVRPRTRKATSGQQWFDRERMVLALIGLAGAAVIVAINIH